MSTKNWIVYLLRCSDNSLYCGISNDVTRRVATHNAGQGAKYTKSRRPVELVATSREMTNWNMASGSCRPMKKLRNWKSGRYNFL